MELKLNVKSPEWWMWTVTLALLALGLLRMNWAFNLAILVSVLQVAYFIRKTGSWMDFATQVRWSYLVLILVARADASHFLFLLMFLATALVVLFDFCVLTMALRRMPWNKEA